MIHLKPGTWETRMAVAQRLLDASERRVLDQAKWRLRVRVWDQLLGPQLGVRGQVWDQLGEQVVYQLQAQLNAR